MTDKDTNDGNASSDKSPIAMVDTADVAPLEDSCSPLPDDATKISKKRLREVSVEASTTKDDENIVPLDAKEVEVPPKKNRLQSLEATDLEVPQRPPPTTPPSTNGRLPGTSPPHESKVRQIRKRVKDLSWQEARQKRSDEGSPGEVDLQDEGLDAGDVASESKAEVDDSSKSVSSKSDSDREEVERAGGDELAASEVTTGPSAGSFARPPSHVDSSASPEPKATIEAPPRTDAEDKRPGKHTTLATVSRVSPEPDVCQGKRRRDDGDQNPREPKRVSPPPDKEKTKAKPEALKSTGFMAYASSISPFAATNNAANAFGSTNPPAFGTSSIPKTPEPSFPAATTPFNNSAPFIPQASAPVTFGSSGFNAYASAASPFATASSSVPSPFGIASTSTSKSPSRVARSKSPGKHVNAFGPYTARSGKFAATSLRPSKKPKRGSSVNGLDSNDVGTGSGSASGSGDEAGDEDAGSPTNFGDILSAKENQPDASEGEKRIEYAEQEVMTGEEDEKTEYQVRAKLFAMTPPPISGWKERGVGTLKLNVDKKTGRARLVLRTDGVLRLVLNTSLFKGMNFEIAQDPRYVKFGLIMDKRVVLHTLRLGSVKHAEDLLEQVKAYTPGVSVTDSTGEV